MNPTAPQPTDIMKVEDAFQLMESGQVINFKYRYAGNVQELCTTELQFKKEEGQYIRINIDPFARRTSVIVSAEQIRHQFKIWHELKADEIEMYHKRMKRFQSGFMGRIYFTDFHKKRIPARQKNSSIVDETVSKEHLYPYLMRLYTECVILPEISLGRRRADFVVFCKDGIHVYEIKSEVDSVSRLAGQIEQYKKYASSVTLVVHSNKLKNLPKDNSLGVLLVSNTGIKQKRKAKQITPSPGVLFDLVWTMELKRLLIGIPGCSNKSRKFYINYMSKALSLELQREYLYQLFMKRYEREDSKRRTESKKSILKAVTQKREFDSACKEGLPLKDFLQPGHFSILQKAGPSPKLRLSKPS